MSTMLCVANCSGSPSSVRSVSACTMDFTAAGTLQPSIRQTNEKRRKEKLTMSFFFFSFQELCCSYLFHLSFQLLSDWRTPLRYFFLLLGGCNLTRYKLELGVTHMKRHKGTVFGFFLFFFVFFSLLSVLWLYFSFFFFCPLFHFVFFFFEPLPLCTHVEKQKEKKKKREREEKKKRCESGASPCKKKKENKRPFFFPYFYTNGVINVLTPSQKGKKLTALVVCVQIGILSGTLRQ